jgi:hypothetical protein
MTIYTHSRLASTLALVSVVISLVPFQAHGKAGVFTGEDFLRYCVSEKPNSTPATRDENDHVIFCLGYLEGAVAMLIGVDRLKYCLPDNAAPGDIVVATVTWLKSHPDRKQNLAAASILNAVIEKWPCR